jgi:hypothetical protein
VGSRQQKVIMDGLPDLAPRGGPNGAIASVDLIDGIMNEIFFDLENG